MGDIILVKPSLPFKNILCTGLLMGYVSYSFQQQFSPVFPNLAFLFVLVCPFKILSFRPILNIFFPLEILIHEVPSCNLEIFLNNYYPLHTWPPL